MTYEIDDEVVLSTHNLHVFQHLVAKLQRHCIGPFPIVKVISLLMYRLELPPNWHIHPVFHASNLKKYHRSKEFERAGQPTPPIVVEGQEDYKVEAILRHKGKGAQYFYLMLWKSYRITKAS